MILRTPRYTRHVCSCLLIALYMFIQNIKTAESRAVSFEQDRAHRMIRELQPEELTSKQPKVCIHGDVVYGPGESVISPDPCQQCECRPPGVECNPVQCPPPSPGCRALHRPDKCCPSYQCECTIGNRTYANGERLDENPNGPCKVCYCRGGEIQCADVGCYRRDDCEPVLVPGQCCPKYDNCPPRDRVSSTIEPTSLESLPSSEILPSSEQVNLYESGPQIMSFETVVTSSEPPAMLSSASVEEDDSRPKITIKEVLPNPKREINSQTDFNSDKSAEKRLLETSSEGYEHPPSVIKVGNEVIILDKGEIKSGQDLSSTPSPIIHVIGAEGLQIGGVDDLHGVETTTPEDRLYSAEITSSEIIADYGSPELDGPTRIPFNLTEEEEEIPPVIPLKTGEEEVNPAYPPIPDDDILPSSNRDEDTTDGKILITSEVVDAFSSYLNETDQNRSGPEVFPTDWLKDNASDTTPEITTRNWLKESMEDSGEQVTQGYEGIDDDASIRGSRERDVNDDVEFIGTTDRGNLDRLVSSSDLSTTLASLIIDEITSSNEHGRSEQEYELLNRVSDEIAKFKLHESNNNFDNVLNIVKDFLDQQAKSGF